MLINFIQAMETKLAYMKITMWVIIALAILLYVGELRVGFKPFSITLNRWILALGWACVLFGVSLLQYDGYESVSKKWSKELQELNKKAMENLDKSREMLDDIESDKAKRDSLNMLLGKKK